MMVRGAVREVLAALVGCQEYTGGREGEDCLFKYTRLEDSAIYATQAQRTCTQPQHPQVHQTLPPPPCDVCMSRALEIVRQRAPRSRRPD